MWLHTSLASVIAIMGLSALGCSSNDSDGGGGDTGGSAGSGTGGSAGGGTGGAGGGTGGSAGSGTGGAGGGTGGTSGSGNYETVTIKTTPRTVLAGDEVFFCQNFTNPFGKNVEVIESESVMTAGSHHMFVFYEPGATDGDVHDCSGLEFKRAVHGAQTPQNKITYPEGVGRPVKTSEGFRVMAHYLNTSGAAVDAEITVTFKVVPEGTVLHQAASIFLNNLAIWVPPNSPGSAKKTCGIPYDIQLINIVSHMHQHAKSFLATASSGETIYETTDWDEPEPRVFDPPLLLEAGTNITFECQYQNNTSVGLTFGDSAVSNEMCILSGVFFPAPNGDTISCL